MITVTRKFMLTVALLPLFRVAVHAQTLSHGRLEELADAHRGRSFEMLREFLSIPNDAHFADQIENNLAWIQQAFEGRNFQTRVLATPGHPLLLVERPSSVASKTVLIYLQVDGQPVDSTRWHQSSPYTPVLKERVDDGWQEIDWGRLQASYDPEWRIFARSASDAKGPIVMFLTALDIMKKESLTPSFNIKVILDFEEEMGSPNLPEAVAKYKDLLHADMLIILDGPRHNTNRSTLTFGARGIATITLTVFGPKLPQHSGHYGNYIPNPALRLAQLLASMKDEDGLVTIAGFYDGVELDAETKAILAKVPDDEEEIKRQLGISQTDKVGASLQEAIQFPSINIRGLSSGWVADKVRTIIPATAVAEIDVRLVSESNPERLIGLIRDHIVAQGYHLVERAPTDDERRQHGKIAAFNYAISYAAYRTPFDSEVGRWLMQAMVRAFKEEPVRKRTSGGSIPISPFVTTLNIPAVTVPTVNPDNNQHSPNENIRLGNVRDGIKTCLAILTQAF